MSKYVNPSGPVFISYRWSDGTKQALSLARHLRASGVPVWLDRTDLPPGDTSRRLKEALKAGLSGAVLVVTEKASRQKGSDAIHDIELPMILETLAQDSRFTVAVLSAIAKKDHPDKIDRDKTAEIYEREEAKGLHHYSALNGGMRAIGPAFAAERLHHLRMGRNLLTIDIQTRHTNTAFASPADLVFRTIPPGQGRVPEREAWEDLKQFLNWLPRLIDDQGVTEVKLAGGAHLSVAYAFGAALPKPSGIKLVIQATDGALWQSTPQGCYKDQNRAPVNMRPSVEELAWRGLGSELALLVDLVPTKASQTFLPYLKAHADNFERGVVIDLKRQLDEQNVSLVVQEIANIIRNLAFEYERVHLFLRCPWGAAVLLGAQMNTLHVTLYEWENATLPSCYVRTITAVSGVGSGPITTIHLN